MIIDPIQAGSMLSTVDKAPEMSTAINIENRQVQEGNSASFLSMIQVIDNKVKSSDSAMKNYILGGNISTHELMISLEQAKHTLKVAVEVRNKMTQAYEKIARIRV
jgi:flagellar hook-basal body complex protein FliE